VVDYQKKHDRIKLDRYEIFFVSSFILMTRTLNSNQTFKIL